jgi:hypothetical protein
LQGFPNAEIGKSKILDMVSAMRSFENVDKNNVEEWLQSDVCELGFQHTDTDTANAAAKQKGEDDDGDNKSEEEGRSSERSSMIVNASVTAWHYSVLIQITLVREGLNTETLQPPGKFILL